jgi:hypothetical protein
VPEIGMPGFDVAGAGNVIMGAGLMASAKGLELPPDPTVGAPVPDPTAALQIPQLWLLYRPLTRDVQATDDRVQGCLPLAERKADGCGCCALPSDLGPPRVRRPSPQVSLAHHLRFSAPVLAVRRCWPTLTQLALHRGESSRCSSGRPAHGRRRVPRDRLSLVRPGR